MLVFFLFCLFSYQKKCFLTWQTSVQVVFFVERVRKPMYYSFQPILWLILTDLNRGLGCFQLFLSGWVYSFNAIAVTFIITLLFFFFFFLKYPALWCHWSGNICLLAGCRSSRTKRECDSSQKAALLVCRSVLSFGSSTEQEKKHFTVQLEINKTKKQLFFSFQLLGKWDNNLRQVYFGQ